MDQPDRDHLPPTPRRIRTPEPSSPPQQTPATTPIHPRTVGGIGHHQSRTHQHQPTNPASATTYAEHPHTRLQEGQYESTVPAIADRAQQERVRNALEPEWEARLDPKQYGFRPALLTVPLSVVCDHVGHNGAAGCWGCGGFASSEPCR